MGVLMRPDYSDVKVSHQGWSILLASLGVIIGIGVIGTKKKMRWFDGGPIGQNPKFDKYGERRTK